MLSAQYATLVPEKDRTSQDGERKRPGILDPGLAARADLDWKGENFRGGRLRETDLRRPSARFGKIKHGT